MQAKHKNFRYFTVAANAGHNRTTQLTSYGRNFQTTIVRGNTPKVEKCNVIQRAHPFFAV
jgi:hypothetical protein